VNRSLRIDADGANDGQGSARSRSSEGIGDGSAALTDPGQLSDDRVSVPRVGVAFPPERTLPACGVMESATARATTAKTRRGPGGRQSPIEISAASGERLQDKDLFVIRDSVAAKFDAHFERMWDAEQPSRWMNLNRPSKR
jgi:hypothetical protein